MLHYYSCTLHYITLPYSTLPLLQVHCNITTTITTTTTTTTNTSTTTVITITTATTARTNQSFTNFLCKIGLLVFPSLGSLNVKRKMKSDSADSSTMTSRILVSFHETLLIHCIYSGWNMDVFNYLLRIPRTQALLRSLFMPLCTNQLLYRIRPLMLPRPMVGNRQVFGIIWP